MVFEARTNAFKFCTSCSTERKKERCRSYQFRNKEKVLAKKKEYRQSEEGKAVSAKYRREYGQRDYAKANRCASEQLRKAHKLRSTPTWFDEEIVQLIYLTAHDIGEQVDHIIPLISDKVCGLHVQNNMQIIPAEINLKNSNTWWPQMPVEGS